MNTPTNNTQQTLLAAALGTLIVLTAALAANTLGQTYDQRTTDQIHSTSLTHARHGWLKQTTQNQYNTPNTP